MSDPQNQRGGDFEFTDRDFRFVSRMIGERAGIVLNESKRELVYGRLVRRLRALGLKRFEDYCEVLQSDDGEEVEHFINALTTNLTSFFREGHHFAYLQNEFLPVFQKSSSNQGLRVWSAGCSTGEEPYSLAMIIAESLGLGRDWKILASDLDSNVVRTASAGVYAVDRVQGIASGRIKKWFLRGSGSREGFVKVVPSLRERIGFRQLNLLEPWPMTKPFDVIFCRNVVIYFDKDTQRKLFDRFADQLVPGGYLFVGHSESLFKVCDRFRPIGGTIYEKLR